MFITDVVYGHSGKDVLLIRIENFNSKILNNGILPGGYVLKLIMINLNFILEYIQV